MQDTNTVKKPQAPTKSREENSPKPCPGSLDGTGRHVWAAATTEIVKYSANGTTLAIPRLARYCTACTLQDILG